MDEDRCAPQLIRAGAPRSLSPAALCPAAAVAPGADLWLAQSCRSLALRAVPIPGPAQAVFKIDLRLISKRLRGEGNVGLGIADIALALRAVFCLGWPPREALQQLQGVIERIAPSRAEIKGPSADPRRLTSLQIRRHYVLDEGKIARLFPVTKNQRLAAIAHGRYKPREHPGVRRARVLTRSKHVEIPQSYEIQAISAVKDAAIQLANQLGNAIRRNGRGRHALMLWQSGRVTINGRRTGKHHAAHTCIARGDENV